MEKYMEENMDNKVVCNCCGKKIPVCGEILQEDVLSVDKDWGYFSGKDGKKHRWCMCEACYDKMTGGFVIPVEEIDRTEMI